MNLKKNKTLTIEILLSMLEDKFKDLELSRRHLADIIKDNNVSLKLTHIRHECFEIFLLKILNLIKDIICIDDTSINALQRQHCYNDVGKRCVITTSSQVK